MNSIYVVASNVVKLFERLDISYAIMGGLAVRMYGIPRPTYDVDFTISIDRDRLDLLYSEAELEGYTIQDSLKSGWIETVKGLSVIKFSWFLDDRSIDVDAFLSETPYQRKVLERRQQHTWQGLLAWFVTPEDLILLKLLANRLKDQVDVADVIFTLGQLDVVYMRHWARQLKITDRLELALNQ